MHKYYLSLLAVFLLVCVAPVWAVDHPVSVGAGGGFMFTPMSLTIDAGDTVTFTNSSGIPHNVHSAASDSMQFECAKGCAGDGSGGTGLPAAGPWSATVSFPSAGTFNYQCDVHVSFGMTGTIHVNGAAATPDFSLAAQSNSVSVTQGGTASDAISITALNGFTGNVTFAASGLPSGVTASFASTSASASTLILSANSTAATGNSTVTVTGTSGSLTHSVSVNLAVNAAASSFSITPGMTGSWYNASQSGHGFNFEVLANNVMLAYWYVYDDSGHNLWLGGVGSYSGDTATLTLTQVGGGFFPPNFDPTHITRTPWGTLTLTFTDCNTGTAAWAPTVSGFSSGSLAITRLTAVSSVACP